MPRRRRRSRGSLGGRPSDRFPASCRRVVAILGPHGEWPIGSGIPNRRWRPHSGLVGERSLAVAVRDGHDCGPSVHRPGVRFSKGRPDAADVGDHAGNRQPAPDAQGASRTRHPGPRAGAPPAAVRAARARPAPAAGARPCPRPRDRAARPPTCRRRRRRHVSTISAMRGSAKRSLELWASTRGWTAWPPGSRAGSVPAGPRRRRREGSRGPSGRRFPGVRFDIGPLAAGVLCKGAAWATVFEQTPSALARRRRRLP